MNGRSDGLSPAPATASASGGPWRPRPGSGALRFPLTCSCVIHLLVLFVPALGTPGRFVAPAAPQGLRTPSGLSVTLVPFHSLRAEERPPAALRAAAAEPPAAGPAQKPEPPAKERPRPGTGADGGSDLLALPSVIYYPTSLLTVRPQPLAIADLDPPPLQPIIASGKIVLTLWIDPQGRTAKVTMESTSLPGVFVSTAVAAFDGLRFKPGEINQQKVGAVMRIEVTYDDARLVSMQVVE